MPAKRIAILLAPVAFSLAGCGTVCNLASGIYKPQTDPKIYGGFLKDVEFVNSDDVRNLHLSPGKAGFVVGICLMTGMAVETTLSIVADTATLPITIPAEYLRDYQASKKQGGAAADSAVVAAPESVPRVQPLPPVVPTDVSCPANQIAPAGAIAPAALPQNDR
jgi:hypothetical protein